MDRARLTEELDAAKAALGKARAALDAERRRFHLPARGARQPRGSAIVTAILRPSQALGRTAVAEGVETEAQRRFLAAEGCPLAQGFLGRPLPAAGVERLLADTVPASPGA